MAFDFLRNLVSAKPAPKREEPSFPGDTELFLLLRRALNARCLLAVTFGEETPAGQAPSAPTLDDGTDEGEATSFNSAILELVREERYFVIDALNPQAGNAAMRADREIDIRVVIDGVELRFHSRVLQVGENAGVRYYKVGFPESFNYAQKRGEHRFRVPLSLRYEVQLLFADDREVTGELRDLSLGGLSARIISGRLDPATDLNAIVMCRLAISKEHSIVTDLELRYIGTAQPPRVPRFGARFVSLSPTMSGRIERLCDELEHHRRNLLG